MTSGTLYGIGVGPGDPELITIRGLRLLQSTRTVFVPVAEASASVEGVSVAETIACGLLLPTQRIERLVFPMRAPLDGREAAWTAHCDRIAAALADGEDASFLVEGDASTYSTFAHLAETMHRTHPEVPTVAVPGVSSFAAAAAAIDRALVDGRERLVLLPGPHERSELDAALQTFEALVLMKVSSDLDTVIDAIEASGRAASATFVERCGWPEQRIVRDIGSLRGERIDYFSLILVRGARAGSRE